jgi:hypothetical protein
MKTLSIGLATRGRPGLMLRTVEKTMEHIRLTGTKLVVLADEDDDGTISTRHRLNQAGALLSIEPRPDALGAKYNRLMKVAPADVYLVMVDYMAHVTPGFDAKIIDAANVYSDGYVIILNYYANSTFSGINAVTHNLASVMGGIYPPYDTQSHFAGFPFWFVDHWLEEIAKRIGRGVFAEVVIQGNKQETIGLRDVQFWAPAFGLLARERAEMAERIISQPDFRCPTEIKKALRRNWPQWEHWSYLVNEAAAEEAQRRNWPQGDRSDPSYNRLFDAAYALVKPRSDEAAKAIAKAAA